jgi:hypothetical protein
VSINGITGRERPASFIWASDNDIATPSCIFHTRIRNNQPFQPSETLFKQVIAHHHGKTEEQHRGIACNHFTMAIQSSFL